MFIKSVRIKNLRTFHDETIDFSDYTCLVGANGAGKSTVLCALNILFRESESSANSVSNLEKEDFHKGETDTPIEITATFTGLSDAAKADFAEYHRQDALVITARAVFDPGTQTAAVKQYGSRLAMEAFAPFFRRLGDGALVPELRGEYEALTRQFDLPNERTKDRMIAALRDYEAARPDECILIPSEDQFYGVSHGQGILRKHVQWVYVPAVKDASGEQAEGKNTALGRLLARTVRSQVNFADRLAELRGRAEEEYRAMLAAEQEALDRISGNLQTRLAEWSNPNATAKLLWHQDPKSSVRIEEPLARLLAGDGEFEGSISRFGHGLQRSYIIALLHGLAELDDENNPKLILGIEEPELYQHPPQARHLASVLQTLSARNAQILVSTHSPYFVDGAGFERVRLVRKLPENGRAVSTSCTLQHLGDEYARVTGEAPAPLAGVSAKLHQVMQPHLTEMFFAPKLILVEGLEDAAYLNAWLVLSGRWDAYRASGAYILPVNGKSELIRPLVIAAKMQIPAYCIFDCDGDKITHDNPAQAASLEQRHRRDNVAILGLVGGDAAVPFPTTIQWGDLYAAWPSDLGKCVEADAGQHWLAAGHVASQAFGNVGGLKKNTLHIAQRLAELQRVNANMNTLDTLCERILAFAT